MADKMTVTDDFLDVKRLELLKDLMHGPSKKDKEDEKKHQKTWFEKEMTLGAFIRAFLLAVLMYPVIGYAYVSLINKLWQTSIH